MTRELLQALLDGATLVGVADGGVQLTLALSAEGVLGAAPEVDILQVEWAVPVPGLGQRELDALLQGRTLTAQYLGQTMTLRLDGDGNSMLFMGGEQLDDQHGYPDERANVERHVWTIA